MRLWNKIQETIYSYKERKKYNEDSVSESCHDVGGFMPWFLLFHAMNWLTSCHELEIESKKEKNETAF